MNRILAVFPFRCPLSVRTLALWIVPVCSWTHPSTYGCFYFNRPAFLCQSDGNPEWEMIREIFAFYHINGHHLYVLILVNKPDENICPFLYPAQPQTFRKNGV